MLPVTYLLLCGWQHLLCFVFSLKIVIFLEPVRDSTSKCDTMKDEN